MSKRKVFLLIVMLTAGTWAFAEEEKTQPADEQKTEKTTEKTGGIEYVEVPDDEVPDAPTVERTEEVSKDAIGGYVLFSDGTKVEGAVRLTPKAVLKFYDPEKKTLLRFRLDEVTHIEQTPTLEKMEKEWRWKENASDEKVYTGHAYPMRKLATTLHLKDGRTLTGEMNALIFVDNANGSRRALLHKRQKGKLDTTLEDLVYVKLVDLRPPEKVEEETDAPAEDGDEGKSETEESNDE